MTNFWTQKSVWMPLALTSAALIAAILVAPTNLGFDHEGKTATVSGRMLGGGSWSPLPMDRVVTGTDLVIRALVVDVEPTRVATPSGKFSPVDPEDGPRQRHRQHIETPVKLEVLEVLSRRPQPAPHATETFRGIAAGHKLTITVAGGRYQWTVSPEDARVLGIMTVEEGPDGEKHEVIPTEPMLMTAEVRPMFDLREGQEVIAFLSVQDESWRKTIRIVGQGAFVMNSQRTHGTQASGHAPAMGMGEIRRYAEKVSKESGRAATGDELQR